jgi:hypothetical protein
MDSDDMQSMITDGYATVAIAYRRAAAAYTIDNEMQQLGTAAVHGKSIGHRNILSLKPSRVIWIFTPYHFDLRNRSLQWRGVFCVQQFNPPL